VSSDTAPVRRYLRYLFGVFLLLDLAALALVLDAKEGTHFAGLLVEVRNAVFSKFVSERADLEAPPSELVKHGFLTDSQEERQKWFEILNSGVRFRAVFAQLEKIPSTIEKAKLIALSYSRNGTPDAEDGHPVRLYDKTADLLFKLATIKEPRGLCSDHAQVFMALCSMVGLDAMEVNCAHTTSAIYCPEWHKWVWIDTEYALLAKKPNGEYMSPLEVRDANLKNEPFEYEFFGTPDHLFSKMDPKDFYLYRPADFCPVYAVEWGNDELTRDASNRQFLFVPTPIRQLISIMTGMHPTYRYLDDEPQIAARYLMIKIAFYLVLLLFLIGNFAFPGYCLIAAIKQSFSQPAVVGSAHIVVSEIVLESQGRTIAI
jgi:hypothetical protein